MATETVIVKTIQSFKRPFGPYSKILRLVLEHDGRLGTTPTMVEAVEAVDAGSFKDARELAELTKMLLENKLLIQETADRLKSLSERVALEVQEDPNGWTDSESDLDSESDPE